MPPKDSRIQLATAVWTARVIPFLLIGAVGYATYVFTVRLCIKFLLYNGNVAHRDHRAAIGLLITYYLLLLPMSACYLRLLYTVNFDAGYLPLNGQQSTSNSSTSTVASEKSHTSYGISESITPFYLKSAYVCQSDGRQAYCSHCHIHKPDRTHHCSDIGRCVRKMDHFCPWVGGVVAETSFKFFIQFVSYTWIYCLYVLVVAAVYLALQHRHDDLEIDPQIAVMLGLAGFFGLFTLGMSSSSSQFAVLNLTTIQNLGKRTHRYMIAIYLPPGTSAETIAAIQMEGFAIKSFARSPNVSESTTATGYELQEAATQYERDSLNIRSFFIVQLEKGENPWDLGSWLLNWKSVMGESVMSWIFPIRQSPTTRRYRSWEDNRLEKGQLLDSEFPFGPIVETYRKRFGLV